MFTADPPPLSTVALAKRHSPRAVNPADMIFDIDPNNWTDLAYLSGYTGEGGNVHYTGDQLGTFSSLGTDIRIGLRPDPHRPGRLAYFHNIAWGDKFRPDNGSMRAELLASSLLVPIPQKQHFWLAASIFLNSGYAARGDDQLFMQCKQEAALGNPFFSLQLADGVIESVVGYRLGRNVAGGSTTLVHPWMDTKPAQPGWMNFVLRGYYTPLDGYPSGCTLWRNGQQLFDYSGPWGFDWDGDKPYARIGWYHWSASWIADVADEAGMTSSGATIINSSVLRADTGTYWYMTATPATNAANWTNSGSASYSLKNVFDQSPDPTRSSYTGRYFLVSDPGLKYNDRDILNELERVT